MEDVLKFVLTLMMVIVVLVTLATILHHWNSSTAQVLHISLAYHMRIYDVLLNTYIYKYDFLYISVENLVCRDTLEAGYQCICHLSETVTIPVNGTECISEFSEVQFAAILHTQCHMLIIIVNQILLNVTLTMEDVSTHAQIQKEASHVDAEQASI